ncbi:MAG: GNAT family N-acetyltransferase, partial [Chitinophagaceae bacterium]
MTTIIEATKDQLPIIHKLAYRIWPTTFGGILTDAQIAYMLNWMYSISSLQKQMEEGSHFIVVQEDKTSVGYASYQLNIEEGVSKLHKIYLLPTAQGKGLGKLLIKEVIKRAKENKQSFLQLNVNRYNKAAHFYTRLGFRVVREEDNDIGNGYFMND